MKIISLLLITMFLQACASYNYSGRFEKTGLYDPTHSNSIEEQSKAYKWKDASDIAVFIGELPQGITNASGVYKSESNAISILGTATAQPSNQNMFTVFFKDYSEDEDWRNVYCPIQGGLYWGTLTLWGLTPFPWPCFVQEGNDSEDISDRKMRIINTLKKTAKAAGGNAIIVTKLGSTQYVNAANNTVYSGLEMTSAEALILKIDSEKAASEDAI